MVCPSLIAKLARPFLPPLPPKSVSVRENNLGGKGLLGSSVQVKNLSNVLWEKDILDPPELEIYRDSNPIHCYSLRLDAVVPADHSHLFSKPGFGIKHPMLL